MARREIEMRRTVPSARMRNTGKPETKPYTGLVILGILLAFGLFILLPLFPPFGVLWCAFAGKVLFDVLKKQGVVKTNVENKVEWKDSGKKAAQKLLSHIKAEGAMEKEFKSHSHTSITYSYDSCAKEKRLEQIRTLKNAGLLTEAEYKERRSSILAEK